MFLVLVKLYLRRVFLIVWDLGGGGGENFCNFRFLLPLLKQNFTSPSPSHGDSMDMGTFLSHLKFFLFLISHTFIVMSMCVLMILSKFPISDIKD